MKLQMFNIAFKAIPVTYSVFTHESKWGVLYGLRTVYRMLSIAVGMKCIFQSDIVGVGLRF